MEKYAVLSALGHDRVGMAADVAEVLKGRGVIIDETRMATLKGQYAMMLHLKGTSEDMRKFRGELAALSVKLKSHLQLDPIESKRSEMPGPEYLIESHCHGPSGLSAVTSILKRHKVNIEDLKTKAQSVPFASRMSFHLTARVSMPRSGPVTELESELKQLEHDRNVHTVLKPSPEVVPG